MEVVPHRGYFMESPGYSIRSGDRGWGRGVVEGLLFCSRPLDKNSFFLFMLLEFIEILCAATTSKINVSVIGRWACRG